MANTKRQYASSGALDISLDGAIAHVGLNRPDKRNAIGDDTIAGLREFFDAVPAGVKCVVLSGHGGNFSAGLDLGEQVKRSGEQVLHHSRNWHRVMDLIQFGRVPVVAVLNGAVMGGGLELAASCHVRIAEGACQFRLPEGQRGIFVGGGAAVRISRIIGADRLTEMMLTGRTFDAEEALRIGLAHYSVEAGGGQSMAGELARTIAGNAQMVNYLAVHAISHIADMPQSAGLFAESLAAALSTTTDDAAEGLAAFLQKRAPSFK